MKSLNGVNISKSSGNNSEYIVKDKNKITIGRFNIRELSTENRSCNINFKFYREYSYDLLKETLNLILTAIYKEKDLFKVNIIVSEDMNLTPFLDIGFVLEGIITTNVISKGMFKDELYLGINREEYNLSQRNHLVKLEGEKIDLKLLTPEDAEELLDYYNRNKTHLEKFEPTREESFYTVENQRSILSENYRQFMQGSSVDFGIYKDSIFIGKIRISNIVQGIFKNGILGYSMDKDYQGNGYMKEAVMLTCDYAFNAMDLHRLEASTLVDNEKSQRVLLGCGFKKLGLNEKYLFINGLWRDHITYYKVKG